LLSLVRGIECEIEYMLLDIPFLHCTVRLSRNYLPYVIRVFVPMCIIMINSTLALHFPAGLDTARLSFVVTNYRSISIHHS
jgi:hypothetical protein